MKKVVVIASLLLLLLLASCTCQRDTTKESTVKLINPLEITKNVVDLSNYVESVSVIPINKEGSDLICDLSKIKKIFVLDNGNIITMSESNIYQFDKLGNLVVKYGERGKGPGEYNKIADICLNIETTELLALEERQGKIYRYDLKDGKFLGNIALKGKINYVDGILPSKDGGVMILTINEFGANDINYNYPFLSVYDKDGNFVSTELTLKDYNVGGTADNVTYSSGRYIVKIQENDNISYQFEKGDKKALYKIHFGDKNIDPLISFDGKESPAVNYMMKVMMNSEKYKIVGNVRLLGNDYIYFVALAPDMTWMSYLMNRDKMSGINWEMGQRSRFAVLGTDEEYMYVSYTHLKENETIDKQPLVNYIARNMGNADDGDVFLVRLKMKDF